MLELPNISPRWNVFARIKQRRRDVKAYRRWVRTQRLQALIRSTPLPDWHPDAHPWDKGSQ